MFNKIKGLKLYAEAEEEEEVVPTETGDNNDENADRSEEIGNNSLDNDFGGFDDGFDEDDTLDTSDYNANDYFDEEIVDGTEGEDSAEFKRRNLALAKAYSSMYDKYKEVILKLKDMDVTGDRAIVLTTIIRKYEELIEALVAYRRECEDTFEVRYKTFVEFRAAFITINEELAKIDADVQLIQ